MNIRSRLLLLVLLAVIGPALLVGIRFVFDREREIETAVAKLSLSGRNLAADLSEKIQGTAQLQYGLARAHDLDTADRAACSSFLSAVREAYPQYTGILTVNPDGQLFCDSLGTGRDLDLRDRDYFKRASQPGAGLVLEPAFGRLTGISVMQIVFPVHGAAGELRYMIVASLNLEKFLVDRAIPDTEILLLDKTGMVMAWSPKETRSRFAGTTLASAPLLSLAMAPPRETGLETQGVDGDVQIWMAADAPILRETGLHILVGQSKAALIAPANRNLLVGLSIVGMAALFLICGVFFLAEISIRRQVARIGQMAVRLGGGDLQARIAPPHPRGELGDLMLQLNGAAESLERQQAAIEDLNQKLRQSQKMEAVGQLTGGVAHDFNNLLTVILGNADLMLDRLKRDPELLAMAEVIMQSAEKGADLTRSLLAFSRRQSLDPRSVDVNQLALGMDKLLRHALGERVDCRFALAAKLPPALVDPSQLEVALLNLAINARDATGEDGRVTIETAETHLDKAYAETQEDLRPGHYVTVAVSDNGCGMSPEILSHVFEPFFTTKEVGKGTGLGLSMVYGFIKQSGGHVRIYSEVGEGTTVKLYLPRAAAVEAKPSGPPEGVPRAQGERVLVVEDDEMVRAYAAMELRALGYDVVAAANGAEALSILRGSEKIDLLFSDVVMPGMLGPQLAEEALRLRPQLKVLFTSGYPQNTAAHQGRIDHGAPLLNKPYRRQELAAKLRAVLQGDGR